MAKSEHVEEGRGGVLFGVGLGPGDPELLTIKAWKILEQSEVIFVPDPGKKGGGRALSTLSSLSSRLLDKVMMVEIPMEEGGSDKWRKVVSAILANLPRGGKGSFVNMGDPLLYGSFIHVIRALREEAPDLRVEVVSGLPSFCAAAAGQVVPLASGQDRVVIAPGPMDAGEMEWLLARSAVLVVLKLNLCMKEFRRFVARNGERVEWWCVENCSLPGEKRCSNEALLSAGEWGYFSVAVVKRRDDLWNEEVPGKEGKGPTREPEGSGITGDAPVHIVPVIPGQEESGERHGRLGNGNR